MGLVFATFGALSAAPEVTYGVEVVPTEGMLIEGQAETTFDATFAEREYLSLTPSSFVAPRQNNKLDYSFAAIVGPMEDIIDGTPGVHALLIAGGAVATLFGTAGSGNYARYAPGGNGSATLYRYFKEDAASQLSVLPLVGARHNWTLNYEAGADITLNVEGGSLYAIPTAFSGATAAPVRTGKGLGPYASNCIAATLNGQPIEIVSLEFTPNLEISIQEDEITACDDGASEILSTAAPMTGTLTIKYDSDLIALAGDNWIRQFLTTEDDYELVVTRDDGGTQTFTLTIPKLRPRDIQVEDGDVRKQWVVEFVALPTTTNDEYELSWDVV